MKTQTQQTVLLGDLIQTVFDEAALFSGDPKEVARLAAQTVAHIVWHGRNPRLPQPSQRLEHGTI